MYNEKKKSMITVYDFGAVGDGITLDTKAINRAIECCEKAGGGTIYFPAGKYLTGTINMKSNITLNIEAGAEILGSPNYEDFPVIPEQYFEGQNKAFYSPIIMGIGLENISMIGQGIINGQGIYWWGLHKLDRKWREYSYNGITEPPKGEEKEFEEARKASSIIRPRLIQFFYCKNVNIEGLTLKNSPMWTINPVGCEYLTLNGLTVENPHNSPNTDGINPEACSNVHIMNCNIDVGDDCITLKSGTEDQGYINKKSCENITITNCTMKSGHGAVVIGSEMSGGVKNVAISNCVFDRTDVGVRIKTRRGRGSVVEAIRVDNLVMNGVFNPIALNMYYDIKEDNNTMLVTAATPIFRNIRFSNITAYNVRSLGFMVGLPEMPIQNVSLENIYIQVANQFDYSNRPLDPGGDSRLTEGLHCNYVKDISFHNVEICEGQNLAINIENGENIEINGLKVSGDKKYDAMIKVNNVKNTYIHGCFAKAVTDQFIETGDGYTEGVVMTGNHPALEKLL